MGGTFEQLKIKLTYCAFNHVLFRLVGFELVVKKFLMKRKKNNQKKTGFESVEKGTLQNNSSQSHTF
jgi:hypothetical protein